MSRQIFNKKIEVDGVNIHYREAGERGNPVMLLLHGFPTSSVMFKNVMVALSDKYHLVAPDYPGFGFSDFPDMNDFDYSFENTSACIKKFTEAINVQSFTVYLHDYGCPIGLRMCVKNPEKIEGIIVQNGNSYIEGIGPQWDETIDYWENPTEEKKKRVAAFLSKDGIKMQYTAGLNDELLTRVSPESWILDWERMSRPGNIEMQFKLNCTYKSNIELFPVFQEYFRVYQPRALIIWGKYDVFYELAEANCYKRDLPEADVHILNAGHMALETNFEEVVSLIECFMCSGGRHQT